MDDSSKKREIPYWIGTTPYLPSEKHEKLIKDCELLFLYGFEGNQVENRVYVCSDMIFTADYVLAPGAFYDPPGLHLYGDESYFVAEGEGLAFNPETGETFLLEEGDTLLIPQGTRHQMYNFTNKQLKIITTVAPRIWASDDMGTVIPKVEHPKFYIPKGKRGESDNE